VEESNDKEDAHLLKGNNCSSGVVIDVVVVLDAVVADDADADVVVDDDMLFRSVKGDTRRPLCRFGCARDSSASVSVSLSGFRALGMWLL
jgi:hypothetical protein